MEPAHRVRPGPVRLRSPVPVCLLMVLATNGADPQTAAAAGIAYWPANGAPVCTEISSKGPPVIASDGAGGAIIAWTESGGIDTEIYAQRIDAAGRPLWAFNGVPVCRAADHQQYAQIISDGAGGAIVTWEDFRNGTDVDIYAQRLAAANGAPEWTRDGIVVCARGGDQTTPQIVSDGQGGAIIAWVDYRGTDRDVYAQRISAVGAPIWAADGVALTTAANDQSGLAIVSDGAAGAIVTWVDFRDGAGQALGDIYAQRVASTGARQWANDGVAVCTAPDRQDLQQVASDGSGGAIVVWADYRTRSTTVRDIYVQRVNATGAPQWVQDGLPLCTANGLQLDPQIVSDGARGAIASWTDYRRGSLDSDIFAQRVNESGNRLWTTNGISLCGAPDRQGGTRLAPDGANGAIVAWYDRRSGTNEIYVQRVSGSGTPQWMPDGEVVTTVGAQPSAIVSDGPNGAIITWADYRNGNFDVYAQHTIGIHHLTRAGVGGSTEGFWPDLHGWQRGNWGSIWFPSWWWGKRPEFDYTYGIDPFTLSEYAEYFSWIATPDVYPDWPAYVRAFGTHDAYWIGFYKKSFVWAWGWAHGGKEFRGACYGMAVAALGAFGHKMAFGQEYPGIGSVDRLFSVDTTAGVRMEVNRLFSHQFGRLHREYVRALDLTTYRPREALADLKMRLGSPNRAGDGVLMLMVFFVGPPPPPPAPAPPPSGGHAVVPYRLERVTIDPTCQGGCWRVYVYDPNLPGSNDSFVLVDSTANSWSYNPLGWFGFHGMAMADPITNSLSNADPVASFPLADEPVIVSGPFRSRPARGEGDPRLFIAATPGARVRVTRRDGASAGFADGVAFTAIDRGAPVFPAVGGETPPVGYDVPRGDYSLTISEVPASRASAAFADGNQVYSVTRDDADSTQTDRLTYQPGAGLGIHSDDVGSTKQVALRTIVVEPTMERALDVRDLRLVDSDSVHVAVSENAGDHRLTVLNLGRDKTYTLQLEEAGASGATSFFHGGVGFGGGTSHVVRPNWRMLGEGPVEVDVDVDGDMIPDSTLVLVNQTTAVEPDLALPVRAALGPAYPNPFTDRLAVRFFLPRTGGVRLAVYDVQGRRVALLVDGERGAGRHEAILEGRHLGIGLFFVQLTTPEGETLTRRVTHIR